MKKIILASGSAQRKKLMDAANINYEVIPADVDETTIRDEDLVVRAEKLARLKGEHVAAQHEGAIIAADTFVENDGEVLEKPVDLDEARKMWRSISGKTVRALTGVCYIDREAEIDFSKTVVAEVSFVELTDADIEKIVEGLPVMTWSGAFSLMWLECMVWCKSVQGSITSVYGLPMEEIYPLLRKSQV